MAALAATFAALALVPVGGVAAEPGPQVQAEQRLDLRILQFNIAGGTRNNGSGTVIDKVFALYQQTQPQIITLNEICENQFAFLQSLFADNGITMFGHFEHTRSYPLINCAFSRAGNAVFAAARITDRSYYGYDGETNKLIEGGPREGRGITCVTAQFSTPVRACAAHLEPTDSVAAEQIAEAARVFRAEAQAMPFVLGGDFNVALDYPAGGTPTIGALYAPEAGGSGEFWEGDMLHDCLTCPPAIRGAATHREGKLDYVFVSRNHFSPAAVAWVQKVEDLGTCGGEVCSDHDALIADASVVNAPARAFQFNLCGAADPGNDQPCVIEADGDAAPAVVSSILDFRPDVVFLNEACIAQSEEITTLLFQRGYVMNEHFSTTRTGVAKCGEQTDATLGNVLLTREALTGVEETPLPDPDGSGPYQLTCADTPLRGKTVKVCVTQLSTAQAARQQQAATVAQKVNGFADAGIPVVLGGDLQAGPEAATTTPLYNHHGGTGQFGEADQTDRAHFTSACSGDFTCRSGEPTLANAAAKYDYIFVSDQFVGVDADATRSNVSNRRPLRAWVTLGQGSGGFGGGGTLPPPGSGNLPPTVSAGPDVSGPEGASLTLRGSAADPESTPSVNWTYSAGSDVDAGATCSFGDAHSASTTITCTDDGTFFATLTADDGVNAPVRDTARVALVNAPPKVTVTGPAPWSVYRAGAPVELGVSFTDAANDTHTCTVTWDDGRTETYPPSGSTCDRTHTFAHPGMYTIKASVTDDDGGTGAGEVMVIVYDTEAGFITTGAQIDSPAGALAADPLHTGTGSFQFNPMYKPSDTGPVLDGGKVSFRLSNTEFELDATHLEWLVVTPDGKAAVKGTGALSGQDEYGFVLYGYDDPDKLRMVIWPLTEGPIPGGTLTYDNRRGKSFDLDVSDPQPVSGGSVQVHD